MEMETCYSCNGRGVYNEPVMTYQILDLIEALRTNETDITFGTKCTNCNGSGRIEKLEEIPF